MDLFIGTFEDFWGALSWLWMLCGAFGQLLGYFYVLWDALGYF